MRTTRQWCDAYIEKATRCAGGNPRGGADAGRCLSRQHGPGGERHPAPGFDNPEAKIIAGALGEVLSVSPRMVAYGSDGFDNAEVVVAFERGSVPAYADAAGPVVKVHRVVA